MSASLLRAQLHAKTFSYDTAEYNFKDILESLYGCKLEFFHKHIGAFKRFERTNDQSTLIHKVFYSNFHRAFKPTYDCFISNVIAPIIYPYQAYYQVIPTFRIGLPGNTFVGEYHKDSNYNHQPYELNFNVGLSAYVGNAALRSQLKPGSDEYILLECPYGSIFSFDHIDCCHGSDPNESDLTMVSFDFRLALKDLYYDSGAGSVNTKTAFKPGSYFSLLPFNA